MSRDKRKLKILPIDELRLCKRSKLNTNEQLYYRWVSKSLCDVPLYALIKAKNCCAFNLTFKYT